MWWWIWVAVKYPIAIGVLPPSLREDERDIGHGGARLRASTDSDLPDASASMPRLVWTSGLHQQGPESKIWPSCCSRRSTGSGRRWRPRKLLTHQGRPALPPAHVCPARADLLARPPSSSHNGFLCPTQNRPKWPFSKMSENRGSWALYSRQ